MRSRRLFSTGELTVSSAAVKHCASGDRRAVGVVFDIDGVLQRGHTPIAGAAQALRLLREHQIPHCFVSVAAVRCCWRPELRQ